MAFRYILRYYIDPGFHEEDRIEELLKICKDGLIEEVMLFQNPEELFQGYPSDGEIDRWFLLAGKVKTALDSAGIAMSINPWATTVHVSRGRMFGSEQSSFQPMVGETGAVSPITACPLDKHWQEQLFRFWTRVASELQPYAIWIEDDWRLHNHGSEMGFGGCFCPVHMKRFSEMIGENVERKTLLKNILEPGHPHSWRKKWLDLSRTTLLEPAEKLYQAVHHVNPEVRIGLMCSVPDIHSAEGRDWEALKRAISPDQPLLLRPHLPPYTENNAMFHPPAIARQTIACFNSELEIYPELENSPRCGKYSKSGTYSIYECYEAALFGSSGITINHYDMMGNGLALDREFPMYLKNAKAQLNAISELHLSDKNAAGVKILFQPDIAVKISSGNQKSMFGLVNQSGLWSNVFSLLGISHQFTKEISGDGGIYAVSGQTLASLTKNELQKLLSGRVILDALSAEYLLQNNFGDLIGVANGSWKTQQDTGYAYEEICCGTAENWGMSGPRMSASRCSERVFFMDVVPSTAIRSWIMRFDRTPITPGSIVFRNCLGGTIYTIAYPIGESQFFPGFFNTFRQMLFQYVLKESFSKEPVLCSKDFPLQSYLNQTDEYIVLSFLNQTSDPCSNFRFSLPCLSNSKIEVLQSNGKWKEQSLQRLGSDIWELKKTIAPLGIAVLRQKRIAL